MENKSSTVKLISSLVLAILFLTQCDAEPKVFYIEIVGSNDSQLQLAPLNFAIEKTNVNTSIQGHKSFTLEIANTSQHEELHQHAAALLRQDVVALIEGSHSSDSACVLSMFTQIPLIRLHGDREDWSECKDVGVSLSVSHGSYARATVQLLETFHWSEVAILYEESFTRVAHGFEAFIDKRKITIYTLKIYKLQDETLKNTITRTVKRLSTFNARVVLLYTSELYQQMLLSEGRCEGTMSYVWIIQGEIATGLTGQSHDMIIGFRLPRESDPTRLDFEARLRSSGSSSKTDLSQLEDNVVLKHDAGRVVAQALSDMSNTNDDWVRMVNGTSLLNKTLLMQHFKKVHLKGISGNIQFNNDGSRDSISLDVINLQNESPVMVGSWKSGKLTITKAFTSDKESTKNATLEGKLLRVVTVEDVPYVVRINGSKYEGFCIDILDRLAAELKFTYEIGPSSDGKYGAEIGGMWNGMIGDLVRKKADMAVAGLTITKLRETAVDFTVAYMRSSTDMILKKDMVEHIDYLQFMTPLQIPVWIMVLVCMLVMTVAIFALNYYSPYGYKNEDGIGTSTEFNLFNSFWFSLACMLQQGGDNTPKSTSGRLLASFYWFGVLILVSTYTANLAAFLAVKRQGLPVNNLEEAFEAGYDIAVAVSSSHYEFFRNSKSEFYQKLWKHMTSKNTFAENGVDGLARARRGKYVLITDGPYLDYLAGQEPCDLMTLPALTKDDSMGFALQENDPHVQDINYAMLRMRRTGFLAHLYRKWWDMGNKCPKPSSIVRQKIVHLGMVAGVYIVLAVGFLVSFAVLGAEIMWYKRRKELVKPPVTNQPDGPCNMPAVAD